MPPWLAETAAIWSFAGAVPVVAALALSVLTEKDERKKVENLRPLVTFVLLCLVLWWVL